MRYGVVSEWLRTVSRFAIVGLVGGVAAACSSDTVRFSEAPFSNPFSRTSEPDPNGTGSIDGRQPGATASVPRSSVQSAPLAPPSASASPVYNKPTAVPARTASSGRAVPGWRTEGGTPVIVAPGETVETLSSRYGVPATAILSANGLTAGQVTAGRRVMIPVYTISRAPAEPAATHAATAPVQGRVVARAKLAAAERPNQEMLRPKSLADQTHMRPGRPKVEAVRMAAASSTKPDGHRAAEPKAHPRPGRTVAAAAQHVPAKVAEAAPAKMADKPAPVGRVVRSEKLPVVREKPVQVAEAKPAPVKVAKVEPAAATVVKPLPQKIASVEPSKAVVAIEPPKPALQAAKEVESTASLPAQPAPAAAADAEFRWPAKGRVITGFGGGASNEGINIAVPDGTPVKAAEAGTVAYAGSEVKGYGNLVLIRHDNGYVSAYAHNGEIDVKRGQRVTRGQLIAKSGQTGNVTSPQLHFEIRKGSTPVDPMKYLASN